MSISALPLPSAGTPGTGTTGAGAAGTTPGNGMFAQLLGQAMKPFDSPVTGRAAGDASVVEGGDGQAGVATAEPAVVESPLPDPTVTEPSDRTRAPVGHFVTATPSARPEALASVVVPAAEVAVTEDEQTANDPVETTGVPAGDDVLIAVEPPVLMGPVATPVADGQEATPLRASAQVLSAVAPSPLKPQLFAAPAAVRTQPAQDATGPAGQLAPTSGNELQVLEQLVGPGLPVTLPGGRLDGLDGSPGALDQPGTLEQSVSSDQPVPGDQPTGLLTPATVVSGPGAAVPAGAAAATQAATYGGPPSAQAAAVLDQVLPSVPRMVLRGDGTSKLSLKLHPADLGEVHLTVSVRDRVVDVTLSAGPDARAALADGTAQLAALLDAVGHTTGQVTIRDLGGAVISTSLGNQTQQQGQPSQGQLDAQLTGEQRGNHDGRGLGRDGRDGPHADHAHGGATSTRTSGTTPRLDPDATGVDVTI